MFAVTLPLLLAYPPEMRDRLLPLVTETLVAGGEIAAAAALLDARKDDPTLDLARAMLQEAKGDSDGALASYDRLAQSRDQSLHARAAARAVELELATGAIDAKQAADRLESLLYAWRGDDQERALRERLAELGQASAHGARRLPCCATARRCSRKTRPPSRPNSPTCSRRCCAATRRTRWHRWNWCQWWRRTPICCRAVRTATPCRQNWPTDWWRSICRSAPAPVLEKLMQAANSGVARAGFGARLAALRLREGDATGALAALDASVAADLPAELAERRTLLVAAANARRGDNDGALGVLATLDSAAADEARATILERANDWPAAQKALTDYAAKTVPAEGKLDDAQRQDTAAPGHRRGARRRRSGADGTAPAARAPGWDRGRWPTCSGCSPPIKFAASPI